MSVVNVVQVCDLVFRIPVTACHNLPVVSS